MALVSSSALGSQGNATVSARIAGRRHSQFSRRGSPGQQSFRALGTFGTRKGCPPTIRAAPKRLAGSATSTSALGKRLPWLNSSQRSSDCNADSARHQHAVPCHSAAVCQVASQQVLTKRTPVVPADRSGGPSVGHARLGFSRGGFWGQGGSQSRWPSKDPRTAEFEKDQRKRVAAEQVGLSCSL